MLSATRQDSICDNSLLGGEHRICLTHGISSKYVCNPIVIATVKLPYVMVGFLASHEAGSPMICANGKLLLLAKACCPIHHPKRLPMTSVSGQHCPSPKSTDSEGLQYCGYWRYHCWCWSSWLSLLRQRLKLQSADYPRRRQTVYVRHADVSVGNVAQTKDVIGFKALVSICNPLMLAMCRPLIGMWMGPVKVVVLVKDWVCLINLTN